MSSLPEGIRRTVRLALGRPRIEEEVDAEVAFHLEMRAAELVARGWTPEAARAEARRRFGDPGQWSEVMSAEDRERVARERRTEWLADLRQDLRHGARSLVRTPLFTLLAVATLALGIGANAAVFGVVKSVLLDALPYADADRLVRVFTRFADGSLERAPLASAMVADIGRRQRSFASLAAFSSEPTDVVYAGPDEPHVGRLAWVEPALFPTLGVPAALGRTFVPEDLGDTARVVVLEHGAWQRFFGGDPGVIGRVVRLNGLPRTVIGVLPRRFVGPTGPADFYFALDLRIHLRNPVNARRLHWFGLVGRLRPGVTVDAAHRELAAIGAELAREHPQFHGKSSISGVGARDAMVGETRRPLLVLLASAGLVLVITCANLAGALLSRTLARRREFAVRVALGAGRGRLVRQLLTESLLLALAGGAAGLLLAWLALGAMRTLAARTLPPYADLTLDPGAVLITALVAIATGVLFGLVPAFAAGRSNIQGTLRDESRGASESRRTRHLRGLLVAGQIALCVSLLAGAGLLARGLWTTTTRPLGFDPAGVLAISVNLPRTAYPDAAARLRFVDRYLERLRAIPGASAAASVGQVPTRVTGGIAPVVDGTPPASGDGQSVLKITEVSDEYFRAMRIPLLAGRDFGPQDASGAPMTVIISERAATHYFPKGNAVGSVLRMNTDAEAPRATVVGVVGDVRNDPARPEPEPALYMTQRQAPWNGPLFVVRAREGSDPLSLAGAARRELAALDPGVPFHEAVTLGALVSNGLSTRRLPVVLMTAFGTLALLLASVGVYAMFAAMAAAREREFGVRVALGSTPRDIAALVLRQGGVWMAAGLLGGAAGVAVVSRLVRGMLFGAPAFDPLAVGAAVGLLVGCAVIALLVPVRRATRVDPISVLR